MTIVKRDLDSIFAGLLLSLFLVLACPFHKNLCSTSAESKSIPKVSIGINTNSFNGTQDNSSEVKLDTNKSRLFSSATISFSRCFVLLYKLALVPAHDEIRCEHPIPIFPLKYYRVVATVFASPNAP